MTKSARITASVIGMTYGLNAGVATSRPSTAESTEIAGVIVPSPRNSAAPNRPSSISTRARAGSFAPRSTSAISAMMPPSPLLPARMMNVTYLIDTTIISAQNTSERIPRTLCSETGTGWWAPPKTSFSA